MVVSEQIGISTLMISARFNWNVLLEIQAQRRKRKRWWKEAFFGRWFKVNGRFGSSGNLHARDLRPA